MAGGTVWSGSPEPEKELAQRVMDCWESFENGPGRELKERDDRMWRMYRGFKRYKSAVAELVAENDRDTSLRDNAERYWGSNLHIPYAYATVETMVARAIDHRPRSLVNPRRSMWADNAQSMQMLLDAQAQRIDIELLWQEQMRDGFIYGLGWGKRYWRRETALRQRVKQRMLAPGKFVVGRLEREVIFDDPDYDVVDPTDMAWDWLRGTVQECGWVAHRMWMTTAQVMDRLQAGFWNTETAGQLTEEDVRAIGSPEKFDEARMDRLLTAGFPRATLAGDVRGEQPHEVIEWHDGNVVLTLLDRSALVQRGVNPCLGHKPFTAYRPTPQRGLLQGISEIEPIEALSRELDTMRSLQLDSAVVSLLAGYAFDSGAVDRDDLQWGPNAAIEVTNGRPSEAIWPLPRPELPASSYQTTQSIMADIERVTGVNDALAGGDGGSIGTATEAQLVQASLSKRVELKSRRFEVEVCKADGRLTMRLNQRMILEARDVRLPADPFQQLEAQNRAEDPYSESDVGRWQWVQLTPMDLMGDFEYELEGGLAAENIPQNRQDAQMWLQLANDPRLDSRAVFLKVLRLMGEKDPQSLLANSPEPVPQVFLQMLQKAGVRPELIDSLLTMARRAEPTLRPQADQQMAQDTGAAQ